MPLTNQCACRQRHDGQRLQLQFAPDAPRRFVAIEDRHLHIHEHDIELLAMGAHVRQGRPAVSAGRDGCTLLFQNASRDLQIDVAVIDHQHAHAGKPLCMQQIKIDRLEYPFMTVMPPRDCGIDRIEQR